MLPTAFRIKDFKSIVDSNVCDLSKDSITILAGQNEAGKTAILEALRDFDAEYGAEPITEDYLPDDVDRSATPTVSVLFSFTEKEARELASGESLTLPEPLLERFKTEPRIWVHRNLEDGVLYFDESIETFWSETEKPPESNSETKENDAEKPELTSLEEFAKVLQNYWPQFIYFDSFEDILPPKVTVSQSPTDAKKYVGSDGKTLGSPVRDFLLLAGVSLSEVFKSKKDDKRLENYFRGRSAQISGDFKEYWKQKVDGEQVVELSIQLRHETSTSITLVFFVNDSHSHYVSQRSRGFRWFLSFFLKLTAANKRSPDSGRVLLIDEPGTYLHARAQRDVLGMFENRLRPEGNVILYSTHSPYLIPPDKLHRLRLVAKIAGDGTKVFNKLRDESLSGEQYEDTLSPILAAIGLDIREQLGFAKPLNIILEGITDYYYLQGFCALLRSDLLARANLFPATGAFSTMPLVSLSIGWGLKWIVLLDHDEQGNAAAQKLKQELLIDSWRIIQPENAKGIEDLFSNSDFLKLAKLAGIDSKGKTAASATQLIKALGTLDKALLARTFAEAVAAKTFTIDPDTKARAIALIASLDASLKQAAKQDGSV
jgi:predicted ATP-dependent endonuclease of OLD family